MTTRTLLVSTVPAGSGPVRALSIEVERALAATGAVDLLLVGDEPVPRWHSRLDRRLPGLSARIPTARRLPDRQYDLVLVHAMIVHDLNRIAPLGPILALADRSAVWVHELWAKNCETLDGAQRQLQRFDRVYVGLEGTAIPLEAVLGKPVRQLLHPVDCLAFAGPPAPPRTVDLQWVGTRHAPAHEALRELSLANGLFYVFDTFGISGTPDLEVHRRQFIDLCRRSRLMVAYPAKFGVPADRGDQDGEIGYRYVEAAAAGTPMIGRRPTTEAWSRFFGWPDSIVEVPENPQRTHEIVTALLDDPDRLARIGADAQAAALRSMDAAHRFVEILGDFGLEVPDGIQRRTKALIELADAL